MKNSFFVRLHRTLRLRLTKRYKRVFHPSIATQHNECIKIRLKLSFYVVLYSKLQEINYALLTFPQDSLSYHSLTSIFFFIITVYSEPMIPSKLFEFISLL